MLKQNFFSCLINASMIPKPKTNMDLLVEKFDSCKKSWHKNFCDDIAKKINQGQFTNAEKETIAKIIDYKFLFSNIDITPSKLLEIYQESDYVHDLDNVTKDEWFDELRSYGVDVDELER